MRRRQATVSAPVRLLDRLSDPSQFELRPTTDGKLLDVGCGSKKHAGAVGIDRSADTDADVVHDLDVTPWPLPDGGFDGIVLQDVIEHLRDPYAVFAEVHFSSVLAYSDPTHLHWLSAAAVRALAQPGFAHYSAVRFRVVSLTLDLWLPFRAVGIAALANRWPDLYERYFAFRFTAMNIRAELEVLK
jgi:SAM-dependent methyltransferase